MKLSPLRQFVLGAMLWLPMCFFLWAVFSSVVVWPAARIADAVLPWLVPDGVTGVVQLGAAIEIETSLQPPVTPGEPVGVLVLTASPLIYAWCLPLFAGLVIATPLRGGQRALQLVVGMTALWLVVAWGAVFEALKLLAFDSGPLGLAAISKAGWTPDGIALGYQFGYLILPATAPVIAWILFNARFLETLVGWRAESEIEPGGPTGAST